jgi:hypothetical protein
MLFSVWSVLRSYLDDNWRYSDVRLFSEESSFETPACRDMSLRAEELN